MQIQISVRHGELEEEQSEYVREKAEKLTRCFSRLMAIQVAIEPVKHSWQVEILISAEHKHDFVATETASTVEEAMDGCARKIEHQVRRYKDKIQHHKGDPSAVDFLNDAEEESPATP